jgi:transcriptional regulator NrdR family protein
VTRSHQLPVNIACPRCSIFKSAVVDTRGSPEGWVFRRRKCTGCGERWSTVEVSEMAIRMLREVPEKLAAANATLIELHAALAKVLVLPD